MSSRSAPTPTHRHPVNVEFLDEAPIGARIADGVTGFMGSWRFLILQTVLVVFWLAGNIYLLSKPFDPYPFILLNLAFSTQAAYAAPLILLAQTRQADRDHADAMVRERHRAEIERHHDEAMERQTELIRQVETLTRQLGEHMRRPEPPS